MHIRKRVSHNDIRNRHRLELVARTKFASTWVRERCRKIVKKVIPTRHAVKLSSLADAIKGSKSWYESSDNINHSRRLSPTSIR